MPAVPRGAGAVVRHDGRAVTVPPAPAVDFSLEAPPEPGVLTWTPSAPLPVGDYSVEVTAVRSVLGADSVPMRRPDRFTLTVT